MRGSMKVVCLFSVCTLKAALAASVGVEDAAGLSSNQLFDAMASAQMAEAARSNSVESAELDEAQAEQAAPAVDRLQPQSEEQRTCQRANGGTYIELASGLNYQDETGVWKSSRVAPKTTANGAVTFDELPVQHTFAPWSGQRVVVESSRRGGPVAKSALGGLSYYDPSSGKSALIAWVTNSPVQAYDGGVFYERAFLGVDADILYKVHPWGLEQDVVIFGGLPDPKAFGMDPAQTKLCALTELVDFDLGQAGVERSGGVEPAAPAVASLEVSTKQGMDWKRLYNWQPGYAYPEEGTMMVGAGDAGDQAHPVAMRLFSAMGRVFLSEEVPFSHVTKSMPGLLDAQVQDGVARVETIQEQNPLALPPVRSDEKLVADQSPTMSPQAYIRRAPRYVLDYVNYYGTNTTGVTFASGQTYYISAPYIVSGGKVTIQPGAFVKLATGAYVKVQGSASLDCRSHAVSPAYFTSAYDTNVGEVVLSGLNPASNRYETALALATTSNNLGGLVIRYAQQAVDLNGSGNSLVQDVQVWNSQSGIKTVGATNRIRNLIVHEGFRGVELNGYYDVVENSTFRDVTFATSGGYILTNLTVRNCVFYNVSLAFSSNAACPAIFEGNAAYNVAAGWMGASVVSLASNTFAVGTYGSNYLVVASAAINAGTTNADLLGLYHYTTATNGMKETNSLVDIGFHYGTAADQDGDGLPDYLEDRSGDGLYASNSVDVSDWQTSDTDGDGLLDGAEYFTHGTNPKSKDTDSDGFSDALEVQNGSDPLNANSTLWSLSGTVSYSGIQTGTLHVLVTSYEPLTNRPAIDYSFDEDRAGYTPDLNGSGLEAIVYGATWSTNGAKGGCYTFDGNDRISLGRLDAANGRYNLTWTAWMRYTGGGVLGGLLGNTAAGNEGIMLMKGGANLRADITPQSRTQTIIAETGGLVTQGVWQMVSGTYDGTQVRLYLNGDLVATSAVYSLEPIRTSTVSATVGDVTDGRGWYFYGDLDEVRIYQSTFTTNQLKSLFFEVGGSVIRRTWTTNVLASSTAFTVPNLPSGSNYWITAWRDANGNGRVDHGEAQGRYSGFVGNLSGHSNNLAITLADPDLDGDGVVDHVEIAAMTDPRSSNSVPVTATGQVVYSGGQTGPIYITARPYETIADTPLLRYSFNTSNSTIVLDESGNGITGTISNAKWTSRGIRNGAYRFDGNANINLGDLSAVEGRTGLTWGAWVNQAYGSSLRGIMGKMVPYGESFLLVSTLSSASFNAQVVPQSRAQARDVVAVGVATGLVWQYVAGTYDGQQTRLYLDGQLIATSPVYAVEGIMSNSTLAALGDVAVGRGWYLNGRMDDLHIYGRCFNANEMYNLAASIRPENIIRVITNAQPGAFVFTNLPNARKYWFEAYRDSDYDGQRDGTEAQVVWSNNPAFLQAGISNILLALGELDTDGDGMHDWWENLFGLNINSNNALADPDGDGRTNIEEYNHPTSAWHNACIQGWSNPTNKDTDADGVSDGPIGGGSITNGPDAFPRDLCANVDNDCDGLPDELRPSCSTSLTADTDDDNDGIADGAEASSLDRLTPITIAPFKAVSIHTRPTNVWLSSYSSMAVAGTNLFPGFDWRPEARNMTLVSNHMWELVHTVQQQANAKFKFVANGAWGNPDWGDDNQTVTNAPITGQVAEQSSGVNIALGGQLNGTYRFLFNEQTRAYSVEKLTLTNMGPEQFDVSSSGRGLPYASGSNASNGYGNVHGGIFFNHDGTNLYLGLAGVDVGERTVLMVFLDTDGVSGGVTNLAHFSNDPEAFGTANNLSFNPTSFTPNVGILVGCKSFRGRNMPWAYVGDNKVGQGVYRLSSTGVYHFAGFSTNGGGLFSQWGDRIGSHSPANAGIEIGLALTDLGLNVGTNFKAAAIFAGGTGSTNRYFSTEAYGESVSSPLGFATNPVTLIGAPVYLSSQAASTTGGMASYSSGDVMMQGFYWAVPRPPFGLHATMSVAGTFNGWNQAANNMTVIGDQTWDYIVNLSAPTGIAFKFVANGDWNSGQWGATNDAAGRSLPISNAVAATSGDGNTDIRVTGAVNGFVRFRLNTKDKRYWVEYVTNGTPIVWLSGYQTNYWHEHLRRLAVTNAFTNFSMIWMPQPVKCDANPWSSGYDPFDHYDLGATNVGSISKNAKFTRYGSDTELIGCVAALNQTGIVPMVDLVINHMAGGYDGGGRYNYQYYHGIFEKRDAAGNNSSNYFNTAGSYEPFQVDLGYGDNSGDVNHRHPYMRNGMKDWGAWLSSKVGYRAYRWDVAYHIEPWFISEFMNYGPMKGQFAVMEGWSLESGFSIKEMETYVALTDHRAAMFDMPLATKLRFMCNDPSGFDMETLNGGSFASIRPEKAVTFVESHDTIREYGGSTNDLKWGITQKKELAYAYVLIAEGYPCVFYHDYFEPPYVDINASSSGWQGTPLKDKIDPLIAARKAYAAGGTEYLSTSNKQYLYIARRTGDGQKPGCILVINNHTTSGLTNTVNVSGFYTNGTILVDALNTNYSITVSGGVANIGASNRAYRVYVKP